jgi:hypothetical protein
MIFLECAGRAKRRQRFGSNSSNTPQKIQSAVDVPTSRDFAGALQICLPLYEIKHVRRDVGRDDA